MIKQGKILDELGIPVYDQCLSRVLLGSMLVIGK